MRIIFSILLSKATRKLRELLFSNSTYCNIIDIIEFIISL